MGVQRGNMVKDTKEERRGERRKEKKGKRKKQKQP
jgi:hypothetical protein